MDRRSICWRGWLLPLLRLLLRDDLKLEALEKGDITEHVARILACV